MKTVIDFRCEEIMLSLFVKVSSTGVQILFYNEHFINFMNPVFNCTKQVFYCFSRSKILGSYPLGNNIIIEGISLSYYVLLDVVSVFQMILREES